jgi:hypothetical protein
VLPEGIPDSLIDKILRTSERVGRQAEFPEWAAEFTLGPGASAERKLDLRNKLAALKKYSAQSYFKQLKAVMDAARNSAPLLAFDQDGEPFATAEPLP